MLRKTLKNESGFTLIELLIVIVIIGLLAGVVLTVINPAEQQRKASEAVVRANSDKVCLAMNACAVTSTTAAASCDSMEKVGNDPSGTPANSTYVVSETPAGTLRADATLPAGGAYPECIYRCTYNITTGVATAPAPVVDADCLVK